MGTFASDPLRVLLATQPEVVTRVLRRLLGSKSI
jgi:hypothetical protein